VAAIPSRSPRSARRSTTTARGGARSSSLSLWIVTSARRRLPLSGAPSSARWPAWQGVGTSLRHAARQILENSPANYAVRHRESRAGPFALLREAGFRRVRVHLQEPGDPRIPLLARGVLVDQCADRPHRADRRRSSWESLYPNRAVFSGRLDVAAELHAAHRERTWPCSSSQSMDGPHQLQPYVDRP